MTTIKLKNGSGAPTSGDLVQGEPALDLTNKRLYTEDSGGTVIEVGTNPTSITTGDITATGTATFANLATSGDVTFGDNDKAIFGAGSDLQIYHDGSNSYITDSGTGNLRISGSLLQLNDASFNKYLLGSGDSVTLYNADSAKLQTTSTGIDVTGSVTADDIVISNGSPTLTFYETDTTNLNARFDNGGGDLYIQTVHDDGTNAKTRILVDHSDGDISFFNNAGSSQDLYWDASTSRLGLGETNPAEELHIDALVPTIRLQDSDGTNQYVNIYQSGGTTNILTRNGTDYGDFYIRRYNGTDLDISFRVQNNGDIIFYGDDGSTQGVKFDASTNRLGIGTTSPANKLTVSESSADFAALIQNSLTSGNGLKIQAGDNSGDRILQLDDKDGNEKFRVTALGNVGIGTSSPLYELHIEDASGNAVVNIESSTTGYSAVNLGDTNNDDVGQIKYDNSTNSMQFTTNASERMRIDSSGNVKVKTGDLQIGESQANSGSGRYVDIYNQGTDSTTFAIMRLIRQQAASTSLTTSEFYARKNGETTIWNFEPSSAAYLRAGVGSTEGWRIHSSGNVLLGKSSPAFGTAGVEINNAGVAGKVHITRSGGEPLALNRLTNTGPLLECYNDSTFAGQLTIESDGFAIDGETSHAGLKFYETAVGPRQNKVLADDAIDLGWSGNRWDDVYATNATIQTSDRNEKQDIEQLSEAEQRVAVACKGLLRKFRWKSAVEKKGDDARIHFGIIAQDLQDAFTAEGLDAGRYGMFINSTWTDEETGEEQSRMGVRYSELLAFIISAI